jgi:hypothetical protein
MRICLILVPNHWKAMIFQLWLARRSGCALAIGSTARIDSEWLLMIHHAISEGFRDRFNWINHNICARSCCSRPVQSGVAVSADLGCPWRRAGSPRVAPRGTESHKR